MIELCSQMIVYYLRMRYGGALKLKALEDYCRERCAEFSYCRAYYVGTRAGRQTPSCNILAAPDHWKDLPDSWLKCDPAKMAAEECKQDEWYMPKLQDCTAICPRSPMRGEMREISGPGGSAAKAEERPLPVSLVNYDGTFTTFGFFRNARKSADCGLRTPHNYCRNPGGQHSSIYCYTAKSGYSIDEDGHCLSSSGQANDQAYAALCAEKNPGMAYKGVLRPVQPDQTCAAFDKGTGWSSEPMELLRAGKKKCSIHMTLCSLSGCCRVSYPVLFLGDRGREGRSHMAVSGR